MPSHTVLRSGDYQILGVLGQGGFGITYRAANQRLAREVAVKEFFPATCERVGRSVSASGGLSPADFDSLRAAFLEEARILARFELPAVVRVMGAWEENASAYMEMELLRGPTLAQVLEERGKLPVDETLRLFEPVLDALEAVHEAGWLHRDIKPHNIIFEPNGSTSTPTPRSISLSDCRAVLLDFGAAKKLAANASQAFSVIVTPGYAPLEQYATRARRGAFTDVYALCATLYHALSGQTPPSASDRAIQDDLIPLRELRPEVPLATARAIEAGLRTEIARRPQSVADLRDALGGGTVPGAVSVASVPGLLPLREKRADELKSRQRSILSSIQSINGTAPPAPPVTPLQAVQMNVPPNVYSTPSAAPAAPPSSAPPSAQQIAQQTMQQAAQINASNASGAAAPVAAPVASPAKSAPPLPVARATTGMAGLSPQTQLHIQKGGLRNAQDQNTWRNGVYAATIGITLLAVIPGLVILNAMISRPEPPLPPPPIVVPNSSFYAPQSQWTAERSLKNAQMSPGGRFVLGETSDSHGRVWNVASRSRVLDIGVLPTEAFWRASWSPDGKYLLVVQQHPHAIKTSPWSYRARVFDVSRGRLQWEKATSRPISTQFLSWDMAHGRVWMRVNNKMRAYSLLKGNDRTPRGPLAIDEALKRNPNARVFEETPQWLQPVDRNMDSSGTPRDMLEVGALNSKDVWRYPVGGGVERLDDMDCQTAASATGKWFLQQGYVDGYNTARIISFKGHLEHEWRIGSGQDDDSYLEPVASADGKALGYLQSRNLLRVWTLESGGGISIRFEGPTQSQLDWWRGEESELASNRDGSLWLVSDKDMELRLLDAAFVEARVASGVRATHATFSKDEKSVFWLNTDTGEMGQTPVKAFSHRVKCERADYFFTRPQVLAP